MTTTTAYLPAHDGVPDGVEWPGLDTLVLLNRPVRPDADPAGMSRFRDDRWDLNQAIFEDHARSSTLNFAFVPRALRLATKFYIWQLINNSRARGLRSANNARLAMHSIELLFTGQLQFVLTWFAERGVTEFCQITQDLLDDYLDALKADEVPVDRCYRRINEIRRLWAHRDLLPARMRLPEAPPWAGEDTQELMGRTRGDRENRTRRIGEVTMQMLLRWALRFL